VMAADSAIEGSLRIALDSGLIRGSISARAPDLARWSKLVGTPLGGSLELTAGLDARAGQSLDLSLTGTRLAAGAGSSRLGIARRRPYPARATAHLVTARQRFQLLRPRLGLGTGSDQRERWSARRSAGARLERRKFAACLGGTPTRLS